MNRRRFIRIAAGSLAGFGLGQTAWSASAVGLRPVRWRGYVLGAEGGFTLYTDDTDSARALIRDCLTEIRRMERLFSLYDPGSELCRLNRTGRLDRPALEWRDLLAVADRAHRVTEGLFDPTVQPLWSLYNDFFRNHPDSLTGPDDAAIERVRACTGWDGVAFEGDALTLRKPDMRLTLNGIAQGYITDHVAEILRSRGFEHVLVELGETRALGAHPGGRPWRIGLKDAQEPARLLDSVDLDNQALATSGAYGSPFSADGRIHHLIHPQSGRSDTRWKSVSVIAEAAAEADALSTGLSFADKALIESIRRTGVRVRTQA